MERAAAGESFLITRRGKPYARLSPPPAADTVPLPCPERPTSPTSTASPIGSSAPTGSPSTSPRPVRATT
jgi:antitoxin (DNA-binding transcriptional repressor) of toxin-antitoxin stability system